MIKCITFCFLLYNMGSIIMTIKLNDAGVCADDNGYVIKYLDFDLLLFEQYFHGIFGEFCHSFSS